MDCHFCHIRIDPQSGVVDIGGLKLCVACYKTRSERTSLPCSVCGRDTPIASDPLITAQICCGCDAGADLTGSYEAARVCLPCDRCGRTEPPHHATVYGQNYCHSCYTETGCPCTQLYPGDRGYPGFITEPSLPAALLPVSSQGGLQCVVCSAAVLDVCGIVAVFEIPPVCEHCIGPKWWDYMRKHRDELRSDALKTNRSTNET
jgi:hypothetical protein